MKDPKKRTRTSYSVSNYKEWLEVLDQVGKERVKELSNNVSFLIVLLAVVVVVGAIVNYLP